MDDIIEKFKKETDIIKNQAKEKFIGYILTALGLVAALAWNEAVKSLIEYFFPLSTNVLWLKFGYAIIITFIVVVVSIYLTKLFNQNKNE